MENNQGTTVSYPTCNASVLKAHTLEQAENFPIQPGKYKVPVVLSEFVIQIDVEAKVKLNFPSYEIKRIEKQVFLTQCRYIGGTDKVFISGYIRKNIEYATKHCTTHSGISGAINDQVVHVPFKCVTRVNFNGAPPRVFPNPQADVARYFDQKRMGKDIREADRASYEIFNEPVYCELEWSQIYDADIDDKGIPVDCLPNEEEFREFTDKSVVYLAVKLLQKQQVYDPRKHDGKDGKDGNDGKCGYDGNDGKATGKTKGKLFNNYGWSNFSDYYTRK